MGFSCPGCANVDCFFKQLAVFNRADLDDDSWLGRRNGGRVVPRSQQLAGAPVQDAVERPGSARGAYPEVKKTSLLITEKTMRTFAGTVSFYIDSSGQSHPGGSSFRGNPSKPDVCALLRKNSQSITLSMIPMARSPDPCRREGYP